MLLQVCLCEGCTLKVSYVCTCSILFTLLSASLKRISNRYISIKRYTANQGDKKTHIKPCRVHRNCRNDMEVKGLGCVVITCLWCVASRIGRKRSITVTNKKYLITVTTIILIHGKGRATRRSFLYGLSMTEDEEDNT